MDIMTWIKRTYKTTSIWRMDIENGYNDTDIENGYNDRNIENGYIDI